MKTNLLLSLALVAGIYSINTVEAVRRTMSHVEGMYPEQQVVADETQSAAMVDGEAQVGVLPGSRRRVAARGYQAGVGQRGMGRRVR